MFKLNDYKVRKMPKKLEKHASQNNKQKVAHNKGYSMRLAKPSKVLLCHLYLRCTDW